MDGFLTLFCLLIFLFSLHDWFLVLLKLFVEIVFNKEREIVCTSINELVSALNRVGKVEETLRAEFRSDAYNIFNCPPLVRVFLLIFLFFGK
jgi:hypothetical protein